MSASILDAWLLLAGAFALTSPVPRSHPDAPLSEIRVDHHVHLNAPAIQRFVPDYCASVARFGRCDSALTTQRTPEDLLREMDRAGIRRALLVSNGYLAESSMVSPPRADATELLRAANDWTVALARKHPDRLTAFIAVDPTRASALPEIARWRGDRAVAGVKIHLTASGTDLRKDADVAALAAVFRAAADSRLAIVIHLRTRRMDFGASDMRRFLSDVLPAARGAPIQIAHVGGWGGFDAATSAALGAFAAELEADPRRYRHVWFDLAGVWNETTSPEDLQALGNLIRRIGPKHFVAGSDWPFTLELAHAYRDVYPLLPLSRDEWQVIRRNVAPYARGPR